MNAQIRTISPAEATRLLETNTNNRSLNKAAVHRYAATMLRGEWLIGNDALCFGSNGVLLNGQHRLNAVILAGAPQAFLIRDNVSPDDLMAMDQGNKRVNSDIVTLMGQKMSRGEAKALRLLGTEWSHTVTMATPTPRELIELSEEWGIYLEKASKLLAPNRRNTGIPTAAAAMALAWCNSDNYARNSERIADFFSLMFENTTVTGRPTDTKDFDFLPAEFHRWMNGLLREGKQLRTYQQFKVVVTGLHAYICAAPIARKKHFNVAEDVTPGTVNPFEG